MERLFDSVWALSAVYDLAPALVREMMRLWVRIWHRNTNFDDEEANPVCDKEK
jgi:hypothetical protein